MIFLLLKSFLKMTFEMTSYKADGDDGKMTGNLTIRGITKPVVLEVEDIAILGDKVGFLLKEKLIVKILI